MAYYSAASKAPKLTLVVSGSQLARQGWGALGSMDRGIAAGSRSPSAMEYGDGLGGRVAAPRTDRAIRILKPLPRSPDSEQRRDIPSPIMDVKEYQKARVARSDNIGIDDIYQRFQLPASPGPVDVNRQLAEENRSLQERITALQRNEQRLLQENRSLAEHVAGLEQRQEAQRRQFEDSLRQSRASFEARIRELENQMCHQQRQMAQQPRANAAAQGDPKWPALSDTDVSAWFAARGESWSAWAQRFAHRNPNRIIELNSYKQQEVRNGVRHFVRLTGDGRLPPPLAPSGGGGGTLDVTTLLLHGMLANFIVSETLASPLWIFAALSGDGGMGPTTTLQLPHSACLSPATPATERLLTARGPRTPSPAQSFDFDVSRSGCDYTLPTQRDVEELFRLLGDSTYRWLSATTLPSAQAHLMCLTARQKPDDVCAWRSQLMKMLCDGGLNRDVADGSPNVASAQQLLARARLAHARRLKDRFLRSPARFLLADLTAESIEELDRRLLAELDSALRFSAQLWSSSHHGSITFVGLAQLDSQKHQDHHHSPFAELCRAQQQQQLRQQRPASPRSASGTDVVMVLQPGVCCAPSDGVAESAASGPSNASVWAKAQVVMGPASMDSPRSASADGQKTPLCLRRAVSARNLTISVPRDVSWV